MSVDQQEFQDPYEVRIGVPTASWKYARRNEGFKGILIPQNGRAYLLGQQKNIAGDLLWWGPGQPRVQQDMLFGFTTLLDGSKLGPTDFISNKATERFEAAATAGDPAATELIDRVNKFGLRRQIIKGESLEKGMRLAVAPFAEKYGPRPVSGATVSFKLEKLEPNDHGGETKIFVITYEPPTAETERKVQEYLAAQPQAGDPYQGQGAGTGGSSAASSGPEDDEDVPF